MFYTYQVKARLLTGGMGRPPERVFRVASSGWSEMASFIDSRAMLSRIFPDAKREDRIEIVDVSLMSTRPEGGVFLGFSEGA